MRRVSDHEHFDAQRVSTFLDRYNDPTKKLTLSARRATLDERMPRPGSA
jgi:hypothetical protein